jgi:DNA-binding MarR family transcriptional regulator
MSEAVLTHIAAILACSHRQVSARLSAELKPLGISFDMWMILGLLPSKVGRSMTDLADSLCLNLPTATKLIDRMVSDNLVYRKSHARDRRRVMVFATESGISVYCEAQKAAELMEAELTDVFGDLSALKKSLGQLRAVE